MQRVVLPLLDEFPDIKVLAWIDDIVLAALDADRLVAALLRAVDLILAFGGRLNIDKCEFMVQRFDWCGVEVDLPTNQWRIAAGRVASLMETPVPTDKEALGHVLGILRYYFWGVADQKSQRENIGFLAELLKRKGLDAPERFAAAWTAAHTTAMRAALAAVTSGEWLLVYDPSQPVTVATDASGSYGYCVAAHQWDPRTGQMRPIAYVSRGWLANQLKWTPQTKECYAQRAAVASIMPQFFPFASVVLLCDNRNLTQAAETDVRIVRWQNDIRDSGCCVRSWIPGKWNTIPDYGSRSVVPAPDAVLSAEEQREMHIYAVVVEDALSRARTSGCTSAGAGSAAEAAPLVAGAHTTESLAETVVVPGHVAMSSMVLKIALAQEDAPAAERESWTGVHYSRAVLGGKSLALYRNRLVVPAGATEVKTVLMRMAHDDTAHYSGAERTVMQLQSQARVHWVGMHAEVQRYVDSCFRCTFAKAAHQKAAAGTLSPTVSPHVHHTWYVDLKGPMPGGTGYLMAVVESVTRLCKLRYLRTNNAAEVIEELDEAIVSFGTLPVVLRCDGGAPFSSGEFSAWCEGNGISPVLGIAYHSQGQGLVETRFRPLAASIMAVLGFKAPSKWWVGGLLAQLEAIINSTYCEPIHGSPFWAMHGFEPRTRLSAKASWAAAAGSGGPLLGLQSARWADVEEIVAQHHAALNAVQGRVMLATSLAQALTKRSFDAGHSPAAFTVGDTVLVHRVAPNRLLPYLPGPFTVESVSADGNFVSAKSYLDGSTRVGPVHVSRLLRFDASRATPEEVVAFQCEEGTFVVLEIIEHRQLGEGLEFHVRWKDTPITTWQPASDLAKVARFKQYCVRNGIVLPDAGSGGSSRTRRRTGRAKA